MPPPPTQTPNPQPHTIYSAVLNNPPSTLSAAAPPPNTALRARANEPSSFTPTQRSLQARSKNHAASQSGESYELRQRRDEAACILESGELLLWYAAARNESIPQTRHHFQNIVLGIAQADDVAWRDEWEVPVDERVRGEGKIGPGSPRGGMGASAKGKEREREGGKGKKRVSLGHAHA